MAEQFLLPCECGHATAVSVAQAGQMVECEACNRQRPLPTLSGLRMLKSARPEGHDSANRKPVFRFTNWRRYVLLILVVLPALVAVTSWIAWTQQIPARPLPPIDLKGTDPEVADAVQAARQEVEQAPRAASAWGKLAMVLHANGFENAADLCYDAASELDPSEATWPYLRGCLHQAGPGGPEAAIPLFERAISLKPRSSTAQLRLAEMLLEQGRLDEASEQYNKIKAARPHDSLALFGVGAVAMARQEYSEAIFHLQSIASHPIVQRRACAMLASAYERLGDTAAAQRERERLLTLPEDGLADDDPMNQVASLKTGVIVRLRRAEMLRQQRRFRESAEVLRDTIARHPDSDGAWANLGLALFFMDDLTGAEDAIRKSILLAPKVAEYHFSLGMLELKRKDYQRAAEAFRTAIQLQPQSGPAYFGLGESLEGQADAKGAGEAYQKTLEYLPDHELARQRLKALKADSSPAGQDDPR